MKLGRLNLIFFAVIFGLMLFSPKVFSQMTPQRQPVSQARPFTDITYEIIVPTQTLLPLQPIPIILRQENLTNQPVLGYRSIGLDNMPIYLEVQKISNNQKKVIGGFSNLIKFVAYHNIEITPNSSSEANGWVMLNLNEYFSETGSYEIKARVLNENRTQSVESNAVTIEIREPAGTDYTVYNLIKNSGFKEYLFSGDEFNKLKPTLENITTSFPNNAYTKSASFVLGEKYFEQGQHVKALTNLLRLENDSEFIFADKVKNYLAEIRRLPQPK